MSAKKLATNIKGKKKSLIFAVNFTIEHTHERQQKKERERISRCALPPFLNYNPI